MNKKIIRKSSLPDIRNIIKTFTGVPALYKITNSLEERETLALPGENEAGKSILIKVL